MCFGVDVLIPRQSSKDLSLRNSALHGHDSVLPPAMSRRAMHHAASLSALIMQYLFPLWLRKINLPYEQIVCGS